MKYTRVPTSRNYTQVLAEPCQGDSPAAIDSFPAATGQEIRNMLSRHGISITDAALILGMSNRYVRSRKRNGTSKGRETWEFLCFLPQRFNTMRSLNDPSRWIRESERQSIKMFNVKNCAERIPCIGIKWKPDTIEEAVLMDASNKHSDSTDILFGRLDNEWSSSEGGFQLPVLTRRPEDHVRAYGSFTLMLAHEHCQTYWDSLQSGDEIDLTIISSAHNNRRVCRADLLKRDSVITQ